MKTTTEYGSFKSHDGKNQYRSVVRRSSNRGVRTKYTRLDSRPLGSSFWSSQEESSSINIVSIVMVGLLVAGLIAFFQGVQRTDLSLLSFLEMLQSVPQVDLSFLNFPNFELSLPAWLEWVDVILSASVSIFNFLVFLVQGLTQAVLLFLYFLGWLF